MFDPDYDSFAEIIAAGSLSAAARAAEERIAGRITRIGGPLRITAPTSFGRMHLAPCLPAFLSTHPEIALELDLTDQFVDLLDSDYDLAIRIAPKIPPGLVGHRLATSRRLLCAAPAYLAQHGTPHTLADLASHRLLAAEGQLPWHLDGPDGTILFPGTSAIRTNSSEVVRELALGHCGIALRSLWDVAAELDAGALVQVLPRHEGSHDVAIFAVHTLAPKVPANVAALMAHLQGALEHRAKRWEAVFA